MSHRVLTSQQTERLRQLDFVIECTAGDPEEFERAVASKTAYLESQGLDRTDFINCGRQG
ncbi:hypothetical protein WDL1P1_00498 (plasmid) [Variovorax sp. WDL1]|uniref:hypothetical protein n=1 Tax=Variovorax sp. WDL1 TaxID=207745 RepID=UPI00076DD2EB|nr:hypothetical protein [Variovorax sp. WDL1]PNG50442.1 hypothetical protein CHC06_06066 [Variovorax sp. B2]PNG51315.1 hypothetical protein CHC07_05972 [Variovorax sp. B4]VTU43284.1 hypothetical protein H6P1_00408 [Variovorax sp. PBL-H6]VTU43314.1 hypothetical protein SRS16P1_00497 [Variovorax sp. SRS16]VTU43336.1 hypothetical protein E5P1_00494 [Variovorax sp. PBL-E5]